jgi:2-iminobutanoate/2-iminopropanoate deaminase
MENVLRVNIYMRSLADFDRVNRVYETFFPEGKRPARTTIGAGELFEGSLIEIDCMARMR